ncbi:MAG: hypothetical protein ACJA06_000305 [Halocynthiibacter sp.]|jgi:hypothetical protein
MRLPSQTPALTDRQALRRNRARAERSALFLHERAAEELQDRLLMVNRRFKSVAIITGQPDFWREQWPEALILEDEDRLALTPGAHDLVIHAMALHWADDPVGQIVQSRLGLAPDGLFLAIFPGGQSLYELRAALAEAEAQISGGLSPRVAPMGEIRDLGALLQRGSFALPVADADTLNVTYGDAFALMRDLRAMGEGNALAARLRTPSKRALFTRAAQIYAENFAAEQGRINATFELICLTGWAPADSQPKPLRPGSATTRLADALGTVEAPLPDATDEK